MMKLYPPTFIEIPTAWWWNQRQVHPSHVLMHSSAFFTWGQLPMVIFRSYGTHHGTWCTKIVMFHEQLLVILVLVGGFNPSEKYEFVSWDDYSQYIYGNIKHVPNHQPECWWMGDFSLSSPSVATLPLFFWIYSWAWNRITGRTVAGDSSPGWGI